MHTIRLASPWRYRCDEDDDWSRISIPDRREPGSPGCRYRRTFNRPTGLTSRTKVELVLEGWLGRAIKLSLNEQVVGEAVERAGERLPLRIDVSEALDSHNTIDVSLTGDGSEKGLLGPIRLEIVEEGNSAD